MKYRVKSISSVVLLAVHLIDGEKTPVASKIRGLFSIVSEYLVSFFALLFWSPMRLSLAFSFIATIPIFRASSATTNKTAFVVSKLGGVREGATKGISVSSLAGINTSTSSNSQRRHMTVDAEYPGTAVERMRAVRERVAHLTFEDLNGRWEDVRRKILWAGGLRDLTDARPGEGYTGHSFNDFNHVDLTCMAEQVSDNEHDGSIDGIALGNRLGPGIRIASIPELGPGGSWSTCAMGCNKDPPQDVAHIQFRSRIAFKLVWVPNERFDTFVLVDDDGNELARGKPTEGLPRLQERQMNYEIVKGSKYARVVDSIARNVAAE